MNSFIDKMNCQKKNKGTKGVFFPPLFPLCYIAVLSFTLSAPGGLISHFLFLSPEQSGVVLFLFLRCFNAKSKKEGESHLVPPTEVDMITNAKHIIKTSLNRLNRVLKFNKLSI